MNESALDWAVVIPLANEEATLPDLLAALRAVMDQTPGGTVYFVVDEASTDETLARCREAEAGDRRFVTCWVPENRNVVDAYISGFRVAIARGHEFIIEMDGGLSHDPAAIPAFLEALRAGRDCVWGSRFIPGGAFEDASVSRRILSVGGTLLARWLLGTRLADMTSGFEGFRRDVLERLVAYPLRSRAHFYQTEVRYLLRDRDAIEIPIVYRAPSPRVSRGAILNSFAVLGYYVRLRLRGRAPTI